MCSSIILQSKIRRVYFSCEDRKAGALINNYKLALNAKNMNKVNVYYGFKEQKFVKLIKNFLKIKDNYFITLHPISFLKYLFSQTT